MASSGFMKFCACQLRIKEQKQDQHTGRNHGGGIRVALVGEERRMIIGYF